MADAHTPAEALMHQFPASTPAARASVLLLPALGMGARYYTPTAHALADLGIDVGVMELRGHGDSPLRPSWRTDFGFRDLLDEDIPQCMRRLRERAPQRPLLLMGHSLGGHLAAMTAARLPESVDGLILAACGSPWLGAYDGATRGRLRLLCALIPPLTALLGHYPGKHIGFGGREARTLMRDWRALAHSNRYRAQGLDDDFDAAIRAYEGPVLSLRMAHDDFAPEAAAEAVLGKFAAAEVQRQVLDDTDLGTKANHFAWVRHPLAVAARIDPWLDRWSATTAASPSSLEEWHA